MRLFLIAAIPLVLSVPVQMAIGLNKIKVIALAALVGSLVNLPVSCYLTARLGVAGVIWGTVLTTLFSNLLVPGVYVFRELQIDPRTYLKRTLSAPMAGAAALIAVTWMLAIAAAGRRERAGHPVAGSCCSCTSPPGTSPTSPAICSSPPAAAISPSWPPGCGGGDHRDGFGGAINPSAAFLPLEQPV